MEIVTLMPDAVHDVKPISAFAALLRLQRQIDTAVICHTNPYAASPEYCRTELTAALAKASVLIDLLVAS